MVQWVYHILQFLDFTKKCEQDWEIKEGGCRKEKENVSIFKVLLPCIYHLFAQTFDFWDFGVLSKKAVSLMELRFVNGHFWLTFELGK